MINKTTILGVNISQITKKETIVTVSSWLRYSSNEVRRKSETSSSNEVRSLKDSSRSLTSNNKSYFIVTPNPEMLVLAQKDREFRNILNSADLAIPDGIGLLWASRLLNKVKSQKSKISPVIPAFTLKGKAGIYTNNQVLTERVSGTDLMVDLCQLASQKGYTVGLLGAGEGVAEKTKQELERQFPGIKIKFALNELSSRPSLSEKKASGGIFFNRDSRIDKDYFNNKVDLSKIPRLRDAKRPFARNDSLDCDLLFVAFGAPKQEKFLYSLIRPIGQISPIRFKVAMGVGGAFDLMSGKIKRAPKVLQDLGLEWLWRLIQEPSRIKRIWTATVVFPWLVVKNFFKQSPSDVSSD